MPRISEAPRDVAVFMRSSNLRLRRCGAAATFAAIAGASQPGFDIRLVEHERHTVVNGSRWRVGIRDDDCARLAVVRASPEQSVFTDGARWCNLSGVPRERTICLAHPRTQYLSPGSRSDTDTDLPGRRLTRAAPNPYSMGTDRREKFLETRGRWEMERMQS